MKLWKKISLVCIAVLATMAMVMGAVLLADSAERMMKLTKSVAQIAEHVYEITTYDKKEK